MYRICQSVLVFVCILFGDITYGKNCSDICKSKGMDLSWAHGTAPFCKGECVTSRYNSNLVVTKGYSKNFITCAGKCTDGKKCLTGSKQCSCAKSIDCTSVCKASGSRFKSGLKFESATCFDGDYTSTCTSGSCPTIMLGWCPGKSLCYCSWSSKVSPGGVGF